MTDTQAVHAPPGTETEPCGDLSIRTLAMPANTNANGDIFGGWLLSQTDIGVTACPLWRGVKRRSDLVCLDAIRAWLPIATEVSSPRPVFASSSECGDWWRFSCHRREPVRPPSGTARSLRGRPHECWCPDILTTKTSIFRWWRWR